MLLKSRLAPQIVGFLLAFAAIAGAWGFQIIGGYVPCKLCLEQREPFYFALPLLAALIVAQLLGWKTRWLPWGLLLVAAIFLIATGIAAYQAGAEWDFWEGPSDCGGGASITDTGAGLLAQMRATKIVSCIHPSLRILGLSFAGWDAVVTVIVAALLAIAARRSIQQG